MSFDATPYYRDPARLRADYREFHAAALASRDVDPTYPVYVALADALGLDRPGRAWLVLVHVAYYHMGSALAAFAGARTADDACLAPLDLPVATERRAHWTRPRLAKHLASVARAARPFGGDLAEWATCDLPDDPHKAWSVLNARLMTIDGNGRWAAFKTAEMLQQIVGVPVAAPDMGHAHSSGPRHGLALLFPGAPTGHSAADVATLDRLSNGLVADLRHRGIDADIERTETTLCDFHALHDGRYYIGHDIDQMQSQLHAIQSPLTGHAVEARAAALPHAYLGEKNGWLGVNKARRGHYRRTGEVITR
ncbi:hypothetical protein [Microbispora sp. NPDC049125]|uniref:ADDT family thymidine hypermodification transferase n=1 Tax=Microbispora sp. NPDC049125 TaxID=3154929 RepID=UPI003465B59E